MAVKKLRKQTRETQKQKWRPKQKKNNTKNVQKPIAVEPKPKQKTLVIAQEIKFARALSSNDKRARERMLKNLRSWLTVRSKSSFAFTEAEFMRLWKGLYYCMWLSDKPLVQEELAESISHLIFCFESLDIVLMYITCTLKTLSYEWFGIDHYRIDKFQMLVRRILRQIFVICKKQLWNKEWVIGVASTIETILVDLKGSLGFKFHVTEVYMEELAKISGGNISEELITEFLRPFAIYLASMTDGRQISHVSRHIFRYLIFQSDVGLDYMDKFKAWKQAGFPTGNIDAMEKLELSDDDNDDDEGDDSEKMDEDECDDKVENNQPLDPRAGCVNVELPQLHFDPEQIANLIKQYKFHPASTRKNRKSITRLIDEFNELAKGVMPIGIKEITIPSAKTADTNPKLAALKLIEFEDQLHADSLRHLNRKKKKKLLAAPNGDIGDDILDVIEVKKPRLELVADDNSDDNNENEYAHEEIVQNKEVESLKVAVLSNKLNKKSLQKELKLKNKKTKTKKMRSFNESIKSELMDGIDDFASFKSTSNMLGNKKKNKQNLNNSWVVSSSESSSVPTEAKKSKCPSGITVTPNVEQSDKPKEKKEKTTHNTPINKIPWLHPVIKKLDTEKLNQQTPTKTPVKQTNTGSSSKKRVQIALQRNTAQATSEYFRQLRLSPAIPFDANKKPLAGVLKPSPLSSPINPFYKKL
ncbi:hypothetical protein PV325_010019 [Microctonus aethiopoides]|uniref:Ribosomal RNA processing protein 1 homolog n=1 Tax=Microctonus aethiopoides TaxID=144406 RepID=A0AA39KXW2_9HYME|nr:hypothetical protein PV325_010019 [Microctonus aethiopoides]KAK0177789.1 hypothetical protein PV328_001800 [Microctonus aethiopoides]